MLVSCVGLYFCLMAILTIYTTFCEKGIFAVAIQQVSANQTVKWETSSGMLKYDDQYTMFVTRKAKGAEREAQMSRSCAHYIDVNGVVNEKAVAADLSKLINTLSRAEEKKAE